MGLATRFHRVVRGVGYQGNAGLRSGLTGHRNWPKARAVDPCMNSMMKRYLSILSVGGVALFAGCSNTGYDNNTNRGIAGGAAAGAVIGGIIGHQSGETGAGAALGAVVGGAAGGAYGHSKDQRTADYQTRDSYGFTDNDYYNLLTSDERETLRARAQGRTDAALTSFLTDDERANLRRRASGQSQVGR